MAQKREVFLIELGFPLLPKVVVCFSTKNLGASLDRIVGEGKNIDRRLLTKNWGIRLAVYVL